jgi:hypothetical protein
MMISYKLLDPQAVTGSSLPRDIIISEVEADTYWCLKQILLEMRVSICTVM